MWLTSGVNCGKVTHAGLLIKDSFIGIEISDVKPTIDEHTKVEKAIEELFGENKKAFPIRLIDI